MTDGTESLPRIGILVVAHANLAESLVAAAEEILGPQEGLAACRLEPSDGEPRQRLSKMITELDDGGGVLVLTDLFGGTPANVALAASDSEPIEVVTGANLPMLIRSLSRRLDYSLTDLAVEAAEYGKRQILLPNALLTD